MSDSPLKFQCTHCLRTLDAPAGAEGTQAPCRHCGETVVVGQSIDPLWGAVQSGIVAHNRLAATPAELLAKPVGEPLWQIQPTLGLYVASGFRLLGLPANVPNSELDAAILRQKNVWKLRPSSEAISAIQTGYDRHLPLADAARLLERMRDPRWRLLCEAFWPHRDQAAFAAVQGGRRLHAPPIEPLLRQAKKGSGLAKVLAQHALAVTCHNLAISRELAYVTGHAEWQAGYWPAALSYWRDVFTPDDFWDYLKLRVKDIDHPQLSEEHVHELRERLPALVLGFNRVFAQAYAAAGDRTACRRHLGLAGQADYPPATCHRVFVDTVQTVAAEQLEPLIQRADNPPWSRERVSRREMALHVDPLLSEGIRVRDHLLHELRLPRDLVAEARFDKLCQVLLDVTDRRTEFDSDDRLRSILYGIVVASRLRLLPLSAAQRRKVEDRMQADQAILYKGFGNIAHDVSRCWFMPGEEADPDVSLELPVYKITHSDLEGVQWESRRVLVPRSGLAHLAHQGKLSAADLASRGDEKGRQAVRQMEKLKREAEAKVAQLGQQQQQALARVLSAHQHRQQELEAKLTPHEQGATRKLQEIDGCYQQAMAAEGVKWDQAMAALVEGHQQALEPIEAEFRKASAPYTGWANAYLLEVPAVAGTVIVLVLAAMALSMGFGLAALASLACGSVLGIGACRVYRHRAVARVQQPLREARRRCQAECDDLSGRRANALTRWEASAEEARQPFAAVLQQCAQRRAQLEQGFQEKVARIQSEYQAKVQAISAQAQRQIGRLQEQIEAHVRPRPLTDKLKYAAYVGARSNGYQDGERPSEAELERIAKQHLDRALRRVRRYLDSLSPYERASLEMVRRSLSEEDFIRLLLRLSEGFPDY
jgi:hypothetical protein